VHTAKTRRAGRASLIKGRNRGVRGAYDSLRVEALSDEFRADTEAVARIHREHVHGRSARGSQPDDESFPKREMVSPAFLAGAKKANDLPAVRIDASEVWPLVRIAMDASQGEVHGIVGAQVLPGDDVFDVVRRLGVLLRMEAVFTTIAGSPTNKLASGRIYQLPG
jgi:hypothetical protein